MRNWFGKAYECYILRFSVCHWPYLGLEDQSRYQVITDRECYPSLTEKQSVNLSALQNLY